MRRFVIKLMVAVLCVLPMVAMLLLGACTRPAPPSPAPAPLPAPPAVLPSPTPALRPPAPPPAPSPAPAPKVLKWKATHFLLRGSESWRITADWAAELKKASGGRLEIEVLGAGEIMPVIETWDACSRGVIPMNITVPGYWLGKCPMANFADPIPGAVPSVRDAYALFHQLGIEELVRKGYAKHNIYLVDITPSYPTTLMTKFPVTKVADLKGKKLRSMGQAGEVLTMAGASTVFLPAAEIYGALEKGLVEGATWGSINTCVEMGWHAVTKYILMPDLFPVLCSDIQVNMDAWNALPDDLKQLLLTSGPRLNEFYAAQVQEWDVRAIEKAMKERGLILTYMPEDERKIFTKYAEIMMDKYAKMDPLCADAAKITKDYMKKKGLL